MFKKKTKKIVEKVEINFKNEPSKYGHWSSCTQPIVMEWDHWNGQKEIDWDVVDYKYGYVHFRCREPIKYDTYCRAHYYLNQFERTRDWHISHEEEAIPLEYR